MLGLMVAGAAVASGDGAAENGAAPPVATGSFDPPKWTDQQEKDFRKHRLAYSRSLKADRLTDQDRQNLTRGIERQMYRLTMPELFDDLPKKVLREIISDLRSPVTSKAARDFILQEIVRIAPELFNQPVTPRLNLAILLTNLDSDHKAEPQVPYIPAAEPLLEMLQQPNQFVVVKLWCAKGLGRICRDADPNIRLRDRIANALLKGLAEVPPHVSSDVREWYLIPFIRALGDTGLVYNINRQPTIIDTLMKIMTNPKEKSWSVRVAALNAISRLQFEPSTNVDLILYEAGKLAHDMAVAFNGNQQRSRRSREDFMWLYFSMIPKQPKEPHQRNWGLVNQIQNRSGLGQYRTKAESLLEVLAPVYNPIVSGGNQVPAASIQNLQQWLQANAPENRRPTPDSQPLPQS